MRARTLFPSRTVTLFELGRTNLALGLEVEAGESFQQYAEQVSDGALDVGQEYEVAGNEKMAVLYYEQALAQAVTKRRPESLERLIRALISSGKSHRIADAIQKYLLVERKESDRTRSLADLLVRTGRHREAIGLMEEAQHRTGGHPKDLEDVMCDYIRYVENYIPDNREKTYGHLDRTKIWNASLITDHPKGRQQWMLGTPEWKW